MINSIKLRMAQYINELGLDLINEIYNDISTGKMLRSKLILSITDENIVDICAIIELIHLASLLHDDVIDNSALRRGVESINSKYGNMSAIMMGDILYSKAYYELTKFDSKIAQLISFAVTQLSIGELLDVALSNSFNEDKNIYFDMIYKKTASLIEASSAVAGVLSGRDYKKFADYGKNLGIAFQIVDDILDITQDEAKLKKPTFSDLKEGKVTLPYLLLLDLANEQEKEFLKSLFKVDLNSLQKSEIRTLMDRYKIIDLSYEIANSYAKKAIKSIEDENLPKLISIVNDMIIREF